MENFKVDKPLVLVIDDNPKSLQIVSRIIDKAGYRPAAATNADQALAIITSTLPDLVLLDTVMPGGSGLDLCKTLKASPRTAGIPVIMLTVKSDAQDIVRGFEAGASDYVSKPFNPEELLARVKAQIELKQINDQQVQLIEELEQALSDIKQLSTLIPICSHCKKIRGDQGYWHQVEEYIARNSAARILPNYCPDCSASKAP